MWRHVVWYLCTDVSEEPPASIILIYDGLQGVRLSKLYYWRDKIKELRMEEHETQTLEVIN